MDSIAQVKRYLPHEISTRIGSVRLYRETKDIGFVCRRYHVSKASLMRWNKQYDGTKESLVSKSHRPLTPHPNAHTEEELKWIRDYHRRTPDISVCELYGKLRQEKAYNRHPGSLYRVFVRLGYRKKVPSTKGKFRHNGKVERSHRNDQQRFYNYLSFYSFDDLQIQMKRYLYRSNNIPMSVLGWQSPNQMQHLLAASCLSD